MRNKHITAEIIADSKNEFGDRITSFIIVCPRIVLAEFNTHRMLSRNSASSRAIPFDTMVQKVLDTPFIPIKWQKDHKGMQGTEYLKGREVDFADRTWLRARDNAVKEATLLNKNNKITKQFCNRLLEPFLYHTIIVTATEWENFFALRAHPAAEIHIADLAQKMLDNYNKSTPKELKAGEWHIPFGGNIDLSRTDLDLFKFEDRGLTEIEMQMLKVKIATARCARVSYLNYEGKDDYKADIKLYDRLSSMGHWSPFEHCAQAMGGFHDSDFRRPLNGMSGNFRGFTQLRKTFENENKSDNRVVK